MTEILEILWLKFPEFVPLKYNGARYIDEITLFFDFLRKEMFEHYIRINPVDKTKIIQFRYRVKGGF